ncbi:hypothetical protein V2J09_006580 [Rumex salicifolius]
MIQYRNLKELLKEEQEPFQTHNPKKNASFPSSFRRNACFCTSSTSSPDPFRKSALFFLPANKNPSDALFLHVPPKTAALLLEAALRVHNNSNSKPRIHYSGFGLLNSLIKRLRIRTRTQIPKTGDDDMVRWAKTSGTASNISDSSSFASSFSDNANEFEKEGKEEEIRFPKGTINDGIGYEESPSPSPRSPAFSSLALSPTCPSFQENLNYEEKLQENPAVKSLAEEDEEEKEQNSPVSILDTPFEDDDCQGEEDGEFYREDSRSDLECSFAFIQRAKRRVLLKLQMFEKLADLYPTKLDDIMEDDEEGDEYDLLTTRHEVEMNIEDFLVDVYWESELKRPWMKRLVSDIISEEHRSIKSTSSSGDLNYNQLIGKRVCKRLESWREVEANTIDMMIDIDFKGEGDKWKKQAEDDDISWAATEIESSIFAGLVEEFLHP